MTPPTHTLVYDGDCAICGRIVARFHRWDRRGRLEIVPSAEAILTARFPTIPASAYRESMQLIRSDGARWQGAAAVEEVLRLLPPVRWVGWLFRLPFARALAERGYATFARNRYRLGCGTHCRLAATPRAGDPDRP